MPLYNKTLRALTYIGQRNIPKLYSCKLPAGNRYTFTNQSTTTPLFQRYRYGVRDIAYTFVSKKWICLTSYDEHKNVNNKDCFDLHTARS